MRDMPEIVHILSSLTSPMLAILVGTLLTAVIQSSSVTVSIVLLMAGVTNYLNIVVTGILSRKKELGIMESVGMTKRQKRMLFMMEGGYYFCAVTVLLVTIGSVMLQWIKTYMETKLSYFVFQYPLIWLVVGLCCLAGISFAVPAGLYMLEKSHCEQ